jgi:hypothetical protein
MMKEPELEEEALTARAVGRTLQATRQTIGDDPGPATIKYPSGRTETMPMTASGPGQYRVERRMEETGLFEVSNGEFSTLVHVGTVDAPEFKAMISTEETLKPYAEKTRGLVTRVASGTGVSLPDILPVRGEVRVSDPNRMVIRMTDETVLRGINSLPLFAGFAGLSALLFAIAAMWWREGR